MNYSVKGYMFQNVNGFTRLVAGWSSTDLVSALGHELLVIGPRLGNSQLW